MGIMSKFKNMFTEEIDDVEPIRKEVMQVEIPAPTKREEIKHEKVISRELDLAKKAVKEEIKEELKEEKKEEKFTFPVFFDDKDFDTIDKTEPSKPEKRVQPYQGSSVEIPREKPKTFKPTPVISPIYGVLDKNYRKEDITDKGNIQTISPACKSVSVDDIRKKAYGTLEDDLENSLLHDGFYDKPAVFREEEDMFEDLDVLTADDYFTDVTLASEEETQTREGTKNVELDNMVAEELNHDEKNKPKEEADLFDLIDSMYEKGDE